MDWYIIEQIIETMAEIKQDPIKAQEWVVQFDGRIKRTEKLISSTVESKEDTSEPQTDTTQE